MKSFYLIEEKTIYFNSSLSLWRKFTKGLQWNIIQFKKTLLLNKSLNEESYPTHTKNGKNLLALNFDW